jgi:hypothetical protein
MTLLLKEIVSQAGPAPALSVPSLPCCEHARVKAPAAHRFRCLCVRKAPAWRVGMYDREPRASPSLHAKQVEKNVDGFAPEEISSIASGLAKLNHPPQSLVSGLSRTVSRRISDFKPEALISTLWAYSTWGEQGVDTGDATQLLAVVTVAVENKLDLFSPEDISNIMWAYAMLGTAPVELLKAIASEVDHKADFFDAHQICRSGFGFLPGPSLASAAGTRAVLMNCAFWCA